MTTPEALCDNPTHTLTTITEGDYIRCGDCGGRLRDDDPRLARATNPSQQQHKPPMVAGDHIVRAKAELAAGEYRPAMAHALVAIAEVLLVSTTEAYGNAMIAGVEAGATATAEAFGQISKILGGGQ